MSLKPLWNWLNDEPDVVENMKNILIVKPSALGDVIQATCVLPVLKNRFPGIGISWLVFSHYAEVLTDHPLIDRVITMDRRKNRFGQLPGLVSELRGQGFDAVIDLQCLLRSALLAFSTGCPRRIGYAGGREHSPLFYTETYDIPREGIHAVDGYLRLCEHLGASRPEDVAFPLPLNDGHREYVRTLLTGRFGPVIRGPVVTVCPTAKWESKCWPPEHFAALAGGLSAKLGAAVVLTGSPGEIEAVRAVERRIEGGCLNLCGRLSLMELAALLEASDLFVGNDSGPMHLAAATRTRTVAVFGPTDPVRTGPYNPRAVVVKSELDCMPCFMKRCGEMRCLRDLAPERVARICEEALQFFMP